LPRPIMDFRMMRVSGGSDSGKGDFDSRHGQNHHRMERGKC
jgi:hypothetical protein